MKNNEEMFIDRKIEFLKTSLEDIREDFRVNLKPKLKEFEYTEFTHAKLEQIQNIIKRFINKNSINIKVCVYKYNDNIVIIGNTLIDEIVWEHIQN